MGKSIKLNLGCGRKKWDGFINVDYPNKWHPVTPDVMCDIKNLPFKDNSADEIHAIHVIEHLYVWEVESALIEWQRVLKPSSKMILELPDLEKVLWWFQKSSNLILTWFALYGDPKYKDPHMNHKWAYTFNMLKELLEKLGFIEIQKTEALFHVPERDMRVEFVKA